MDQRLAHMYNNNLYTGWK